MTWGEWKARIEAEGVHDEDTLDFVDWMDEDGTPGTVAVHRDEDGLVCITNA